MPAWKFESKPIADEHDSQQRCRRAEKDVRVKRPLIAAEEIRFSILQKFERKIRPQVVAIVEDNSHGDSHNQQTQQQIRDQFEAPGVFITVWRHMSDSAWRHMSDSALFAGVGGEFVILAFATRVYPGGLQAAALLCALVPTANSSAKAVFPPG